MSLFDNLSGYWFRIQDSLFPWMEERIGELTNKQLQLVTVLEIIRLEAFIQNCVGFPGRPLEDRIAIARAFVAKMVYNLSTTRALLDRLECDIKLRRICGWGKNLRCRVSLLSLGPLLNLLKANCRRKSMRL